MKILDKVIIVVLIIISILAAGITGFKNFNNKSNTIIIRVDNKIVKQIALNSNGNNEIYDFKFNGDIGYLEVKGGKVRMLEMDKVICPNAICSDTGWIDKAYETIICLPNNIVVTIEGSKEDVDSQSY